MASKTEKKISQPITIYEYTQHGTVYEYVYYFNNNNNNNNLFPIDNVGSGCPFFRARG
jgi:hypothetical protein